MKKRILATLLALVMALGLCVTTAWADETVHELRQADINNGIYWQPNGESDVYENYLKGGSYKLMENIVLESQLLVDEDSTGGVTIDLNGYTLSLKAGVGTHVLFVFNEGAVLTLMDSSAGKTGKIIGGSGFNDEDGVLMGGGIFVSGADFYMNGGTITGNAASKGGAVYLSNSTMHANGGTVSGPVYADGYSGILVSEEYEYLYHKQTEFLDTVTTVDGPNGGVFKKPLVKEGSDRKWIFGGQYWDDPLENENFEAETPRFVIAFDNNGSEYATAYVFYMVHTVNDGVKSCTLAAPDAPTREGYKFLGWFTAPEGDESAEKWDFATDRVTSETYDDGVTLYAHWEQLPAKNEGEPTTEIKHNNNEPINRQDTAVTTPVTKADDTTKTDTVTSAKTFDAGVAVYAVMGVMSLTGSAWVAGKKRV